MYKDIYTALLQRMRGERKKGGTLHNEDKLHMKGTITPPIP